MGCISFTLLLTSVSTKISYNNSTLDVRFTKHFLIILIYFLSKDFKSTKKLGTSNLIFYLHVVVVRAKDFRNNFLYIVDLISKNKICLQK